MNFYVIFGKVPSDYNFLNFNKSKVICFTLAKRSYYIDL